MENGLKEIRKDALQNGLVLGAILLILDVIALYTLAHSKSVLLVFVAYLFGYLFIPLTAVILLINNLRKKIGGYWTLRQATSGIFIMFITGFLISSAINFVFVKFIQPQITLLAKDNFIKLITGFFSRINAEPDKVDELVANLEQQFNAVGPTSAGAVISNLLSSILILFIIALIFAAIFKKERPIINQPESPL